MQARTDLVSLLDLPALGSLQFSDRGLYGRPDRIAFSDLCCGQIRLSLSDVIRRSPRRRGSGLRGGDERYNACIVDRSIG